MYIGGFWIHPAELMIKNVDTPKFSSELHIGAFPVKYNPDAHLYGEYLFRYNTYPIHLNNYGTNGENILIGKYLANYYYLENIPLDFYIQPYSHRQYSDTAGFNIEGIKWETTFFGQSINNHFSFYFDDGFRLTRDCFFTWIMDFQLNEMFGIGAGWQYRFGKSYSTPKQRSSSNQPIPENQLDYYGYEAASSKLMGRGFLNIRKMLGIQGYFKNSNAGKIFFEGAILGIKNYSFYYEDRLERVALTYGIYLPSSGLLDIFCLQGEYFNKMVYPSLGYYPRTTLFQYGLHMEKSIRKIFQVVFEGAYQRKAAHKYGRSSKMWSFSLKLVYNI
jgi:hypothetical protein